LEYISQKNSLLEESHYNKFKHKLAQSDFEFLQLPSIPSPYKKVSHVLTKYKTNNKIDILKCGIKLDVHQQLCRYVTVKFAENSMVEKINKNAFEIVKYIMNSNVFNVDKLCDNLFTLFNFYSSFNQEILYYIFDHSEFQRKVIMNQSNVQYMKKIIKSQCNKKCFNLLAYNDSNLGFLTIIKNANIIDEINTYIVEYINLKLPVSNETMAFIFNEKKICQKDYDNIYNERIKILLLNSVKLDVNTIKVFYQHYIYFNSENKQLLNMMIGIELDPFVHFSIISDLFKDSDEWYAITFISKTLIFVVHELLKRIQIIDNVNNVFFDKFVDLVILNVESKNFIEELINLLLGYGYQLSQERFKELCECGLEIQMNDQKNINFNNEIYEICVNNSFYPNYKFEGINEHLHGLRRLCTNRNTKLTTIKNYMKKHNVIPDNICLENAMLNKLTMKIIILLMDNKCVPTNKITHLCYDKRYIFVLDRGLKNLKEQQGINY